MLDIKLNKKRLKEPPLHVRGGFFSSINGLIMRQNGFYRVVMPACYDLAIPRGKEDSPYEMFGMWKR